MRMDTNKTLSVPNSPPIRTAFCLRVEQAATCLGPTPPRVPGCLRIAEWRRQARICSSHFDVRSASSNAHEISSTICQPSFNGKPKATADIPKHCRLRLAVKRGHCFVSVASGLIHPLFSPAGRSVTDDFPPDHPHQPRQAGHGAGRSPLERLRASAASPLSGRPPPSAASEADGGS